MRFSVNFVHIECDLYPDRFSHLVCLTARGTSFKVPTKLVKYTHGYNIRLYGVNSGDAYTLEISPKELRRLNEYLGFDTMYCKCTPLIVCPEHYKTSVEY